MKAGIVLDEHEMTKSGDIGRQTELSESQRKLQPAEPVARLVGYSARFTLLYLDFAL